MDLCNESAHHMCGSHETVQHLGGRFLLSHLQDWPDLRNCRSGEWRFCSCWPAVGRNLVDLLGELDWSEHRTMTAAFLSLLQLWCVSEHWVEGHDLGLVVPESSLRPSGSESLYIVSLPVVVTMSDDVLQHHQSEKKVTQFLKERRKVYKSLIFSCKAWKKREYKEKGKIGAIASQFQAIHFQNNKNERDCFKNHFSITQSTFAFFFTIFLKAIFLVSFLFWRGTWLDSFWGPTLVWIQLRVCE